MKIPGLDSVQPTSTEEIISVESTRNCQLCTSKPSQYNCPKCNISYCSSVCFKSSAHQKCSESFYKDQIRLSMGKQHHRSSPDEKTKILDIINRNSNVTTSSSELLDEFMVNCAVDGDGGADDIMEIIEDFDFSIDDSSEDIWKKLPAKHKKKFLKEFVPRSAHLVQLWRPWWISVYQQNAREKISDISSPDNPELDQMETIKYPKQVDIPTLLKEQVRRRLKANAINGKLILFSIEIILSYALITRYFNNSLSEFVNVDIDNEEQSGEDNDIIVTNITETLKKTCPYLTLNQTNHFYACTKEAIDITIMRIQEFQFEQLRNRHQSHSHSSRAFLNPNVVEDSKSTGEYLQNRRFISTLLQDSILIFGQWKFIQLALSDIHTFLKKNNNNHAIGVYSVKKLEYMMAYLFEISGDFETKDLVDHLVLDQLEESRRRVDEETAEFVEQCNQVSKITKEQKQKPQNIIEVIEE